MTRPDWIYNFAFYVADGTSSWGDPPNGATYSGLIVTGAGRPLIHSRIRAPRPIQAPDAYNAG